MVFQSQQEANVRCLAESKTELLRAEHKLASVEANVQNETDAPSPV